MVILALACTLTSIAEAEDNALYGANLPAGLTINKVYKPGHGESIGAVTSLQGEVVVIHTNLPDGYLMRNGVPIYWRDTIITPENGRIRFKLDDGNIMVVASQTRLMIDGNVYSLDKKAGSSFLSVFMGKVRYFGSKKVGSNLIEFQVSTETTIAGVRGDTAEAPAEAPPLPSGYTWVPVAKEKVPAEVMEVFAEEMKLMEKEMREDMKREEEDFEKEMKEMEKEMKSSPLKDVNK